MVKMKSKIVYLPLIFALGSSGCYFNQAQTKPNQQNQNSNSNKNAQTSKNYGEPKKIFDLNDREITESSGLVVSRKNTGAFWTHNDSGDAAFLYAFDKSGQRLGTWKIADAKNVDWEDIAPYTDARTGESYIFIGDIGNNTRARGEAQIYRVVEPKITTADKNSRRKNPVVIADSDKITIVYPDTHHDAETLLVDPKTGNLYVISKSLSGQANIYKIKAGFKNGDKLTPELIGTISVPALAGGFLTGGAISPDGSRLALCDYFAAYEYVLPKDAKNFDEIFKNAPDVIQLGQRAQGESIAYSPDGKTLYATSEKRPMPLIAVERK